jgi:hypothetical protein
MAPRAPIALPVPAARLTGYLVVISGFNTDVECAGTVYHVQTEDKGAPHHVIMSLVYDRGTILASKREPYDTAVSEKELKERLDKQHKLFCAAIKAGRIDDLKQMTAANRGARSAPKVVTESAPPAASKPGITVVEPATVIDALPASTDEHIAEEPAIEIPSIALDPIPPPPAAHADSFAEVPIVEAVVVEEYPEILPADAVEVVSELSGQSRPAHNKLGIELLGDEKFRSGDRKTLSVMVCRGSDRRVIAGAQIMIKILGSSFRPVIFHARSDQNGLARVHLQVPQFAAGRAALLVRAIADGEEVELRRLVTAGS